MALSCTQSEDEKNRALVEANGIQIGSRVIRTGEAQRNAKIHGSSSAPGPGAPPVNKLSAAEADALGAADTTNTTLFVGGVDSSITEDALGQVRTFRPCRPCGRGADLCAAREDPTFCAARDLRAESSRRSPISCQLPPTASEAPLFPHLLTLWAPCGRHSPGSGP